MRALLIRYICWWFIIFAWLSYACMQTPDDQEPVPLSTNCKRRAPGQQPSLSLTPVQRRRKRRRRKRFMQRRERRWRRSRPRGLWNYKSSSSDSSDSSSFSDFSEHSNFSDFSENSNISGSSSSSGSNVNPSEQKRKRDWTAKRLYPGSNFAAVDFVRSLLAIMVCGKMTRKGARMLFKLLKCSHNNGENNLPSYRQTLTQVERYRYQVRTEHECKISIWASALNICMA